MHELASDHALQRELLDDWHRQSGFDVFVASYQHPRSEAWAVRSFAVWSDGADTMLPRCDLVMLHSPGDPGSTVEARWADVVELAGRLMEPVDLTPPRWRVRAVPDAAVIAALRARGDSAG